ncbi:MAG: LacI family DNA-binding transcriptional regulator [Acidobacteriaceae bacterium]
MNISEVAKRAKVSTATVSRTINGKGVVRPETAERVWDVVHALGYHPNTHARALVSGRSQLLGLIISDITNPFFPELVKSFEQVALKHGFEIIVANTGYDPERMSHCVRRMLERKVDGVAVFTSEMEDGLIAQLEERRIPIVFLDTGQVRNRISNIKVDYEKGIHEAIEHLFHLKHQRIAFISGPLELRSAQIRRTAFLKWLDHYQLLLDDHLIETGNHKIEGGEAAMLRLLALTRRPTAVLASNDLTAIGALRAIYSANLRVPDDISVIGYDDIDFSRFTQPALTTVRLSRSELADKALEALTAVIGQKTVSGREFLVGTELIVRGSTTENRENPAEFSQMPEGMSENEQRQPLVSVSGRLPVSTK